jgi:predicted RNA-binding protein with PIN domain
MHIIIDGYNLIRQSDTLSELDRRDLQTGREALVDALAEYRRLRPHAITVVFDGTHAPALSSRRDLRKGIHIRFSRPGETADAVIGRMASSERERALVVTSDRAVASHATACGADAVDSNAFETRIRLAASTADGSGDGEESAGWKPTTRKKGPSRRLSKKARRMRKKLRKL